MSRKKTNGKGFALGTLVGGLCGGITALLFAPKSGDKLRKDIAKKYHHTADKAHDVLDDMCEQSSHLYKKAKHLASDAKTTASKAIKRKR